MSEVRRLVVSFSGGRTSAYMTKRILDTWQDRYDDIVVLFANTGQEHEKTLEFVHNCDVHFGFNTVWLEAEPQEEYGIGCHGKIVDYETASRNGEPYEAAIKKYGIFSPDNPVCTDRLKMMPIKHYVRKQLQWKPRTHEQAIGIRVDEIDRMSMHAEKNRIIYPLIKWAITKTMVLDWWADQSFDLGLDEHYGNCVWCWKKSERKLLTIAKNDPQYFEFPARMEAENGTYTNSKGVHFENQVFFRKHMSANDIIARSKEPFIEWRPGIEQQQMGLFSLDEMDYGSGCSESCEVEGI